MLHKCYIEKCTISTTHIYPKFLNCLANVESILTKKEIPKIIVKPLCNTCNTNNFYQISNIIWTDNIQHKIEKHNLYPSEKFIQIITNISIIDGHIINPPIEFPPNESKIKYIFLSHNNLLKLDSLMESGSQPIYVSGDKYVYTEHSGVLEINDNTLTSIVINSDDTSRTSNSDEDILLPSNTPNFENHTFIYHTHPNTKILAGRINQGVLYEFPSPSDIFNYIKYSQSHILQASIVVSPEGVYIIRNISASIKKNLNNKKTLFKTLHNFLINLEKEAIQKHNNSKIHNPDYFHEHVGLDFTFIDMYNNFLKPWNIFIEYYPREKINNIWLLRPLSLVQRNLTN